MLWPESIHAPDIFFLIKNYVKVDSIHLGRKPKCRIEEKELNEFSHINTIPQYKWIPNIIVALLLLAHFLNCCFNL